VPSERLQLDEELLDLRTATQRLARGVIGPSISARLAEIADELLELARRDAQMWPAGKADHRGQATA
jgi:hypothetical protein